MVIAFIVLAQHLYNCKGFKMPKIHLDIEGREIDRADFEALLPEGAVVTGYDTGNGNTHVEIESTDPIAGILKASISVEPQTDDEAAATEAAADAHLTHLGGFNEGELVDMLVAAGVNANPYGTTVTVNMSRMELDSLCLENQVGEPGPPPSADEYVTPEAAAAAGATGGEPLVPETKTEGDESASGEGEQPTPGGGEGVAIVDSESAGAEGTTPAEGNAPSEGAADAGANPTAG